MIDIIIILLCLVLTAFFAGTETAFVARLYRSGTGIVEWWRQRPERIIATTLVGTNLSIVIASSVATERAISLYGHWGELFVIIGMSLIALIFCEIIPKSAALRWSGTWTSLAGYPLLMFHWVLYLIIIVTSYFSRGITAIIEKISSDKSPAPAEMMEVLRKPMRGLDEGRLFALMVFLRFAGHRAMDIMIPSSKIVTIKLGTEAEKAHEILDGGSPYVIVTDNDTPVGVLDDEIAGILSPNERITLERISVLVTPETKDAFEFLWESSKNSFPPALVVDEFGSITGAIGGEPMISRITRTPSYHTNRTLELPGTSIILRADTPIERIEMITGLTIPKGPYQTLGGLIIELYREIPKSHSIFVWNSLQFRIISADARSIHRIEVTRIE